VTNINFQIHKFTDLMQQYLVTMETYFRVIRGYVLLCRYCLYLFRV